MTQAEMVQMAKAAAAKYGLDPALVCAIVEQESSWNTYALRSESESGFQKRYGAAYTALVKHSATKNDDRWIGFEDIFYASYGLMQTMYPCVIEMFPDVDIQLIFPTQLCDPETGLMVGCRMFARKLAGAGNNVRVGLLRWNGGADPDYPDKVLAKITKYQSAESATP